MVVEWYLLHFYASRRICGHVLLSAVEAVEGHNPFGHWDLAACVFRVGHLQCAVTVLHDVFLLIGSQ